MRRFVAFLPLAALLGCGSSGSSEPAASPSAVAYAAQVATYLHQAESAAGDDHQQIDHPAAAVTAFEGFVVAVQSVAFPPDKEFAKGQIVSQANRVIADLRLTERFLSPECSPIGGPPPSDCPGPGEGSSSGADQQVLDQLVAALP